MIYSEQDSSAEAKGSLKELAFLFLRLGAIAFGGPAAHLAMMEDEIVDRRQWLTRGQFLDLIGAANLIPGPNSTEVAIHIGYQRAGWAGLLVAGSCFIFPAAIIVTAIAWAYVKFGALPQVAGILYGIKPVIIAVVLQALWRFGKTALKTKTLIIIGIVALALDVAGINELIVLAVAGIVAGVAKFINQRKLCSGKQLSVLLPAMTTSQAAQVIAASGVAAASFSMWSLFLFFLKVGSVLFGSGYVLLVFLRADLVERWHWLSESQLIDAIAVGQVTPGPVFTTATFIGYILGGMTGAVVATIGIFIPAFIFVGISGPIVPRVRKSVIAGAVLDGVNIASLALMAIVTWQLARGSVTDIFAVTIFVTSVLTLIRYRLNAAWLVLGGGVVGFVIFLVSRTATP